MCNCANPCAPCLTMQGMDHLITASTPAVGSCGCGNHDSSVPLELMDEWHEKYKARLMEVGGLTDQQAQDACDAGMDDFDYLQDPEGAADMEMSYWGN